MHFCKFEGFGNDYIVIESETIPSPVSANELAKKICDRHYGAGADGIAVLEKLSAAGADYSCRIINPDGSEAGFSGNGTRCAAAYLYYNNLWSAETLRLSLPSGVKTYRLTETILSGHYWFDAEIGSPKFAPVDIPFLSNKSDVINEQLTINNQQLTFTALNVGNPVACIFVEDFDSIDWRAIGKQIESHTRFPERANVVFIKPASRENIEIRIWERGAGETSSSGTCSVAAAVASTQAGETERRVSVHAPGGTTVVNWRESDDEIVMTGRADLVFCGEWPEF
jgi:diaminopimelate epimerase